MSETEESNYSEGGWISWFCNLEDHHFFCEVDQDYIKDNFNLYGLKKLFTHYKSAHQRSPQHDSRPRKSRRR